MNKVTNQIQNKEGRVLWIDFAKFLGILFVLLNHMELNIPYIGDYGYVFCVAMFFVLSGYNYHRREESFESFIKRKARRLLIPYFGYSFFLLLFSFLKDYVITGKMFHMQISDLLPLAGIFYARNSLYPLQSAHNVQFLTIWNSPMWFLPALFLTTVIFEFCLRISDNNWKKLSLNTLVIFALGIALLYISPILLPWSFDTSLLFAVFMCSGYIAQHRIQYLRKSGKVKFSTSQILTLDLILFVVSAMLIHLNGPINISVGDFGRIVSIGTIVQLLSAYSVLGLCYLVRKQIPMGAVLIGRASLTIMCMHMFVFMFIKAGISLINPTLLSTNSIFSVFCKAMGISITFIVLTIFDLYLQNIKRNNKGNRKNNE